MLRVRSLKSRGKPFVCAFCQQKPPTNAPTKFERDFSIYETRKPSKESILLVAGWSRRSSQNVRWFHATTHQNESKSGLPSLENFPGATSVGGGGGWGSFANTNRTSDPPPSDDGLLPYERAARQRFNTSGSTYNGRLSDKANLPTQHNHAVNKPKDISPQANKSRSVLADVFKSSRAPRRPPVPNSWSSDAGAVADLTRLSGVPSGSGKAPQDSSRRSTTSNLKTTGWGSFSHRKSELTTHPHGPDKRGNESTIWSEITKVNRSKLRASRPGIKPRNQDKAATGSGTVQGKDDAPQDFWGELETRAIVFGDNRSSRMKEATGRRRDQTNTTEIDNIREPSILVGTHQPDAQPMKPRRKSRFETDEVEPDSEDRRSKKNKKTQRFQRLSEDNDWDDESVHRWEQKQRRKAEKEAQKQKAAEIEQISTPIFLPEYISAANLAKALKQRGDFFLRDMEDMGFENITNDTIFTGETAALVAMEYGFDPKVDSGSLRDLRPKAPPQDMSILPPRPPVVTIMGHVDHGKTTLLDWLRKSSIAAQEHGGITQHIGAFVVKMSSGKCITFLDTPGHAAFLSMRQRGANVTDIVVLVVAADDGVMPQTIEALKHATSAKVPIIVAITKVDKEDAKVDQVKGDLSRHGVEIEDYGGDVQVVCVSGKTGQGMEDLEENIVTLSEILDVRAEDNGMAEGWILESSIKPQGKAATILVKRGTLRPGDFIVAGKTWARIRVLKNEAGIELAEAPPGTPVEVLGWRNLPSAGEQMLQSPDEGSAKTAVDYRREMAEREQSSIQLAEQEQRQRDKAAAEAAAAEADSGLNTAQESADAGAITQNFSVKADVAGSVEAVCGTILELGNHEVQPKILRSSAGQITEYDIDHASASNSVIVNFNCPIQPHIKQRAEEAKVKILDHNVIYHVVDEVKAALSDMLPMNISFRVSGEADVLQVFPINIKKRSYKNIAGCRVRNGSIKRSSRVKILRKGEVVFDGKIDTLKHVKKDVQEMSKGSECGIGLEDFDDFQPDDQIQTYEEIKEKRYL